MRIIWVVATAAINNKSALSIRVELLVRNLIDLPHHVLRLRFDINSHPCRIRGSHRYSPPFKLPTKPNLAHSQSTLGEKSNMRNRQRTDVSESMTVVIKLGTSSILNEDTLQPQLSILSSIAETVVGLKKQGHQVVIVSSGAIAYGMKRMNMSKKPKALAEKQVRFMTRVGLAALDTLCFRTGFGCNRAVTAHGCLRLPLQ